MTFKFSKFFPHIFRADERIFSAFSLCCPCPDSIRRPKDSFFSVFAHKSPIQQLSRDFFVISSHTIEIISALLNVFSSHRESESVYHRRQTAAKHKQHKSEFNTYQPINPNRDSSLPFRATPTGFFVVNNIFLFCFYLFDEN